MVVASVATRSTIWLNSAWEMLFYWNEIGLRLEQLGIPVRMAFQKSLALLFDYSYFFKKLLFLPCWNDAWWCCPVQPALYGSKCLKIIQNSPISLKMNELIDWLPSLRPSDVDVRLLTHTHQLLGGLEDETGVDPGYIVNGGLFIASSKVRPIQSTPLEWGKKIPSS